MPQDDSPIHASNETAPSPWLLVPRLEVIPPGGALSSSGPLAIPGSKSITNRALLVASLAQGRSTLRGTLASDDTRHMTTALRAMGVRIEKASDGTTVHVDATGALRAPSAPLMLGNAGTATRFLTAAAALADGDVVIDGDEHMRKRPISPLVAALAQLGIEASTETGCPPVVVRGRGGFSGARVEVDANLSSQYVSALLMLAARGREAVEVAFRGAEGGIIGARGYVDLTVATMRAFGASVAQVGAGRWRVEPTGYRAADYAVEPDASSCTYLWAIEALTGSRFEYQVPPDALTQPDARALEVIRTFPRMPSVIDGSQMQDAVPTLAALAALNETPVRFVGIANLRVKECDRLRALATELSRVKPGLAVEEGDDLVVHGDPSLAGARAPASIETYSDHRIAMSFSLLGLKVHGIVINDPGCVSKTFPGYWDVLTALGVGLRPGASR